MTSPAAIWPVNVAVISATPPQTAETMPDTDVALWLEIDHSRSVQLPTCGSPVSVPDDQLPSKSEVEAGELDELAELAELDELEAPPVPVADAGLAEGAVGVNSSVVFLNSQPVASTELKTISQRKYLVILAPLHS